MSEQFNIVTRLYYLLSRLYIEASVVKFETSLKVCVKVQGYLVVQFITFTAVD